MRSCSFSRKRKKISSYADYNANVLISRKDIQLFKIKNDFLTFALEKARHWIYALQQLLNVESSSSLNFKFAFLFAKI